MAHSGVSAFCREFDFHNVSRYTYALSAIIVVGLILRAYDLGGAALWTDEVKVVVAAESVLRTGEPVLPSGNLYTRASLHTHIVALSIGIFGASETAARLPSVLFSTLTIPLVYFFTKKVTSREAGLVAALLLATMAFEIAWGRQVRMYPLYQFMFLATLTYWVYVRDELTPKRIGGVLALVWLTSLAHATWVIILPILALDALIHVTIDDERYRTARKWLLAFAGLYIAIVVVFQHPVFPSWMYGLAFAPVTDASFWGDPLFFFIERMPVLTLFAIVGIYALLAELPRSSTPLIGLGASLFAVSYFGTVVHLVVFWPRYIYFLLPLFCVVSAAGMVFTYRWCRPILEALAGAIVPGDRAKSQAPAAVFVVVLLVLALTAPALSPAPDRLSWIDEPQPDYRTAVEEMGHLHDDSHFVASNRPLLVWYYLGDVDMRVDPGDWGLIMSGTRSSSFYAGVPVTESNDDLREAVRENDCGWVLYNQFPGVEEPGWIEQNLEHYTTVDGPYEPIEYINEGATQRQDVHVYRWGDCWDN